MSYLGDYDASTVIYGKFTTFRPSTGAAFTLGGTPALSVYKDNSTTQSTTGVTLTADFDSVTGLNHFAIDTSADGTFYSAGSNFDIVITTGTVDSVSVVGSVVGRFSLRKNSSLKPTTAGRTLDVSAGGEAGVDWANVGSPTTTLNLSGTTVKAVTDRVTANTDQWNGTAVTSATVRSDLINIAGVAVSTSTAQLGVNVVNFGGSAGTFSSGRPEVNATHWGGTAVASALVRGNLIQVNGSATPVTNIATVFDTDFALNYDAVDDRWIVDVASIRGESVTHSGAFDFDTLKTAYQNVNTYLDTSISSRMATYTQPTGFLAATFPTTVASTTNITAGTITTVTGSVTVGTNNDKTGYALSAAGLADFFDTNSGTTYASAVAGSVVKEIADNAGGSGLTVAAIADGIWEEASADHNTAGTMGAKMNSAASAGDPWSTTLPGSYTGTQAGFIIGTIRAAQLNILSPHVAEDSSTEIVIGDDYYAADNRNLSFSYGASPSLSGATVTLEIQEDTTAEDSDTNYTSTSGTVSGTNPQVVSFDLPGTTTADLSEGWHAYRVKAVLSNSHTVTLTRGRINLLARGDDAP